MGVQLMNEQRTSWNIQLIERVLWPHDAEIIKSFKLQDGPRDDVIAWHYEKSGSFSVISAYRLAKQLDFQECDGQSSSTNGQGRDLFGVPYGDYRCRKKLCGRGPESIYHALAECVHARAMWEAMAERWDLPPKKQLTNSGPEWLLLIASLPKHKGALVALICWRIWFVRNEITHKQRLIPLNVSVSFLCKYLDELLLTQD
jgi:hypothetical protein